MKIANFFLLYNGADVLLAGGRSTTNVPGWLSIHIEDDKEQMQENQKMFRLH